MQDSEGDEGVVNGFSEVADGDTSSSASSTPIKTGPFNPLYIVRVPDAAKNGEFLQFTITVSKPEDEDTGTTVVRQYDDIEWLQHCLMTQGNVDGCIIPPIPRRPECDAKAAESKSKKQLGSETNVIMADEFQKDCRNVEKYLKLVVAHEVYGRNEVLRSFLCDAEPPQKTRVKRGILNRLSSAMDEARKGQHKDIDEYFQKERDWASKYSVAIKEASANFIRVIYAQMRLAGCYGHLATALKDAVLYRDKPNTQVNKYLAQLSEGVQNAKHGMEVLSANDDKTLGYQLDLYSRYSDSLKDMLFRRTCLLVTYQDANRTLEKAKPVKRAAAEEAKSSAEKAFEDCSENARRELKTFMHQRVLAFEEGLSSFAESQIKTARDTYTLLVRSLMAVKQMDN